MKLKQRLLPVVAGMAVMAGPTVASAQDLTVAYFQEWPLPYEYAKVTGMYEDAMDADIKWRAFGSGTEMSAAMASGDVQIAFSQGMPPFVVAVSSGVDNQLVDIAVSYAANDNCVVAEELEIDKNSAGELEGKTVATPLGNTAHFGFLKQMEHFGVDVSTMEIINMNPPEAAAALAQGSVDMACGWGGALRRMKEHGNVLMTGPEKEAAGILVFDVISTTSDYMAKRPGQLATFLAVTNQANAMWNSGENTDEMLPVIANDSGMELEDAKASLATFSFPSIEEKLSKKWLGGGVQEILNGAAALFVETGNIDSALDSYDDNVNTGPLEQADSM